MTDARIQHMVSRFLSWRLPENFNPDGGISFKKTFNDHTPHPMKAEPVGTNLFDAVQAEAMVRHMLDEMPVDEKDAELLRLREQWSGAKVAINKAVDVLDAFADVFAELNTKDGAHDAALCTDTSRALWAVINTEGETE